VALFGPSDPAVWAPRGERVRVVSTAQAGAPIEDITLDQVLAAVRAATAAGIEAGYC
jgi:hypothetical protein